MKVFEKIEQEILENGLKIASYDFNKPWGGFFVIEEAQSRKFAEIYFESLNFENLRLNGKLSPKILLVKPGARLSWQYHFRRSEIWKVHVGPVGIIRSLDNNQGELVEAFAGQIVTLSKE